MIYDCINLTNTDLLSFNIKNVANMNYMLYDYNNIKNIRIYLILKNMLIR